MSDSAPSQSPTHLYDVAFSYAGEDRNYVERVVNAMAGRARVFYDRHEQVDLWGKDLYQHLSDVYGRKSRFCVLFISAHYARKVWTNHERESAQARAFGDHDAHLLPARFDDTPIPGLSPAVSAIDLRTLTPEAFSALLLEKLRTSEEGAPTARSRPMWAAAVLGAVAVLALKMVTGLVEFRAMAAPAVPDAGTPSVEPRSSKYGSSAPAGVPTQIVDATGPGSTVNVDGGLHMTVIHPGGSQTVRASKGARVNVQAVEYKEVSGTRDATP